MPGDRCSGMVLALPDQLSGQSARHGSGSSNGRVWARNRISSSITDAIVMAFRAGPGPFGRQLLPRFGDLVELETEQPAMLVDAGQQQLVPGGFGRFGVGG
jgi:hypothetical protein